MDIPWNAGKRQDARMVGRTQHFLRKEPIVEIDGQQYELWGAYFSIPGAIGRKINVIVWEDFGARVISAERAYLDSFIFYSVRHIIFLAVLLVLWFFVGGAA